MLDKTKVEMLRLAFIDVVQDIRQSFQDADIRGFKVEMKASGRSFGGDAKLEVGVSTDEYGSNRVSSPNLIDAHVEAMRRQGFDVRNEALALPAPGGQIEEEIPL